MNQTKPKIVKREEKQRRTDLEVRRAENERSLEVKFLQMLIVKYPQKAEKFVNDLRAQTV